MNWATSGTNTINITTDTAGVFNNFIPTYNEYLEWLPEACQWEKYIPIWHLVKSYPKHKCEVAWYDEEKQIMDWCCRYCGKMML